MASYTNAALSVKFYGLRHGEHSESAASILCRREFYLEESDLLRFGVLGKGTQFHVSWPLCSKSGYIVADMDG